MYEAGLDFADAERVCKTGKITKGEIDVAPPQYRMEGFTSDGDHVGFAVSFSEEEKWIELITAFRVRE